MMPGAAAGTLQASFSLFTAPFFFFPCYAASAKMSVHFKMSRWILRSAGHKVTETMIEMLAWLTAGVPPDDLVGTDGN